MKQFKLIFWAIMIGFLVLLIFQNQEYFFAETTLNVDFYFNENKNPVPPVPNVLLFLAFFFTGLFIAYIFSLLGQYKAKKNIKNLNATLRSQMEVLSGLKSEIAAKDAQIEQLQNQPVIASKPEPEQNAEAVEEKAEVNAEVLDETDSKEADPIKETGPIKEEESKIS